MLRAIHLKAANMKSDWTAALAEMTVSRVTGVARVVAVKSMGVVSVMFDDSSTNAERIVRALKAAGLDVRVLSGS